MSYKPIESLLSTTNDSIYNLVILASQRALELAEGMPTFIENRDSDKPTVLSLAEIAEGKVGMQISQDKPKAKPEEKPKEEKKETSKEKAKEQPKEKAKEKSSGKTKKKSK